MKKILSFFKTLLGMKDKKDRSTSENVNENKKETAIKKIKELLVRIYEREIYYSDISFNSNRPLYSVFGNVSGWNYEAIKRIMNESGITWNDIACISEQEIERIVKSHIEWNMRISNAGKENDRRWAEIMEESFDDMEMSSGS